MRAIELPADPTQRADAFLAEFMAAPNDADIEVRLGTMNGEPSVGISIGGRMHGFTAQEARALADSAESALRAYPNERDAEGLPNLILALRMGADKADQTMAKLP